MTFLKAFRSWVNVWLQHIYMVHVVQPLYWFCVKHIPWFFAVAYLNIHKADHKAQGALLDPQFLMQLINAINERKDNAEDSK